MIFKFIIFIVAITLLVCNKQMAKAALESNKKLYGFDINPWQYRLPLIVGGLIILTLLFFDTFIWKE